MENYSNLSQTLENMTVREEPENRYAKLSTVLFQSGTPSEGNEKKATELQAEQREAFKNQCEVTIANLERQKMAVLAAREKYANGVNLHSRNSKNPIEGNSHREKAVAVGQVNATGHLELKAILGRAKRQLTELLT